MVSKPRNFAIVGGDLRSVHLANLLFAQNNNVVVYGICHDVLKAPQCAELNAAIADADIIILPLPMTNPDDTIVAPFYESPIQLSALLRLMNKNQLLLGGKISSGTKKRMEIHGVYAIDYFEREDLTVTNAMITAEGAIQTLLNAYEKTICNSKILILGYGRIGKFLAKILNGFHAEITVAARKAETQAWVCANGYAYSNIDSESTYNTDYDVIFNTVPFPVLTKERTNNLKPECIIIDLASAPGGTDFDAAQTRGIQAIHALSLPGKTAPVSAGDAIANTILHICNDLGV